jgi:uncharacterized damage-inducible protein DinB
MSIEPALAEFSAVRAATLRVMAPLTQAQLDFAPGSGRWSIGEILDHLLLAENLYRREIEGLIALKRAGKTPYLTRSFADVNVAPIFVPDAMLTWLELPFRLINRFVPSALREAMMEYPLMPMRNPDVGRPHAGRPAVDLRAELAGSLERTHAVLTANRDIDFSELVFDHPLMGTNNVPQILHFLAAHERRHQGQIDDVRRKRAFPA